MRRIISIGAALVLLVTLGLVSAATQSSADGKKHRKHVEVIKLVEKTVQQADLDLGEEGPSLGDEFVFSSKLFRKGHFAGTDGGACQVVNIKSEEQATVQCVVTADLKRRGQITVQGLVTFSEEDESFVLAITGGTGDFKTAHGQVVVTPVSEEISKLKLIVIH